MNPPRTLSELIASRGDLQQRIDALVEEGAPIRAQLANIDRQRDKLRNELSAVKARIGQMQEKPRVSDHALVRYLERKYGFDFENVRNEMLTPTILSAMEIGAEGVKFNGGLVKIKGRTVVTYVENGK